MGSWMDRRATLLRHNIGSWDSQFVRFDNKGREQERFPCHLEVLEMGDAIFSTLTYVNTGRTGQMRFHEPPEEMQISPEGHWSLGPSFNGYGAWVSEFCLCGGDRRCRAVIRHDSHGLASLVLIMEWRSGTPPVTIPAEIQLDPHSLDSTGCTGMQGWSWQKGVTLIAMAERHQGQAQVCGLHWTQPDGVDREIMRRHSSDGYLLPLSV